MKTYLNFHLTGKQFLPLWIMFYLFFVIPYVLGLIKLQTFKNQVPVPPSSGWIFLLFFLLIIVALVWTLFLVRITLQNTSLNDTPVKPEYNPWRYIGMIFLGFFLSIITIGIYSPWFIRNVHRYFINNASWKENNFSFQGKGGKLWVILTLTLVLPVIIVSIIMVVLLHGKGINTHSMSFRLVYQVIVSLLLIPYMYLIYKWMVNIKYKEYHIRWNTEFFPAAGKIAREIILSIISCGIYFPLAYLKLYKYFTGKTQSNVVDNKRIRFGYDLAPKNDFLMLWGQILLTIITLGIYYPWAFCKISKRVLGKTYIEKTETPLSSVL